jgi:hypothetical protein
MFVQNNGFIKIVMDDMQELDSIYHDQDSNTLINHYKSKSRKERLAIGKVHYLRNL